MILATAKLNQLNKNIVLSAIFKALNIAFVVLIVRRSIDVLGVEGYGIWTAITSISMWISLLDVGIGNGLRIELRRCFLEEDWKEARTLLNTAYIFIGLFMAAFLIIFFVIWLNTDWASVFNVKNYSVHNVNILVLVTVSGLMIQLIFSLIQPVLNANLHSGFEGVFYTMSNGLILCYLFLVDSQTINILQYGFVSAYFPILVYIGFSLFYFFRYLPQLMPDLKETNFSKIKPILLVSGKFFFMQISGVLLYQMTSFLIIHYFTPNQVAEYNIAFRYFNLFNIVFMTLLGPLWSLSTDAYLRGDMAWIIKTVKKYILLVLFIFLAILFGYIMRDFVFKLWLKNVSVSPRIAMYVAIYMGVLCWNSIFLYVVTGAGKINLQFMLAILTMVLFLPLTHFLVKILNWGIDGIFISNIIILLISSILIPIQAYFVLKTNKKSYWLS